MDGYWFDFDLTSYALFSHARLLNDKLSIALGVRHDSYDEHLLELRRGNSLCGQSTISRAN